jgi:hypothetical protein
LNSKEKNKVTFGSQGLIKKMVHQGVIGM